MPIPDFNLKGNVALITGASRGIGQAIAEAFAACGADVVLSSRKQENLDIVAEKINAAGGKSVAVAAHTGDQAAVDNLISQAVDCFGGIDILVNNAATNPHFGPILSAEESHWAKTFDVNVMGYFRLAKACADIMEARGGGKIINMASVAGKTPLLGMGVYCVTKAAVIMLTEVLAAELAEANIQVNAIAPGFVKTRFSRVLWENQQVYEIITKKIPQHRMADPQEITGAALYLASQTSSFTTGTTLFVDGGQLVGSSL
jgi:NAD(P)-dependent dehydrogenase (short-subunit alcohol dehydrogenase family)